MTAALNGKSASSRRAFAFSSPPSAARATNLQAPFLDIGSYWCCSGTIGARILPLKFEVYPNVSSGQAQHGSAILPAYANCSVRCRKPR